MTGDTKAVPISEAELAQLLADHHARMIANQRRTADQRPSQSLPPPYVLPKVKCSSDDARLIRCRVWVRQRRDGSSPQFGSARLKELAQRQRIR